MYVFFFTVFRSVALDCLTAKAVVAGRVEQRGMLPQSARISMMPACSIIHPKLRLWYSNQSIRGLPARMSPKPYRIDLANFSSLYLNFTHSPRYLWMDSVQIRQFQDLCFHIQNSTSWMLLKHAANYTQ